jgi:hypothetical protein
MSHRQRAPGNKAEAHTLNPKNYGTHLWEGESMKILLILASLGAFAWAFDRTLDAMADAVAVLELPQ